MGVAAHTRAHARRASPGSRRRSDGRPVGLCTPREKTCRSPSRQRASPHAAGAPSARRAATPAAPRSQPVSWPLQAQRVYTTRRPGIVRRCSGVASSPLWLWRSRPRAARVAMTTRRSGRPGAPRPRTRGGDRPAVRSAPVGRRPGSAGVAQGRARRRGAHVDPGGDDVRGRRARLGAGPLPAQSRRRHDPGAHRRRVRGRVRPADGSTICCCRESASSGPSSKPTSSTEAARSPPYATPAA